MGVSTRLCTTASPRSGRGTCSELAGGRAQQARLPRSSGAPPPPRSLTASPAARPRPPCQSSGVFRYTCPRPGTSRWSPGQCWVICPLSRQYPSPDTVCAGCPCWHPEAGARDWGSDLGLTSRDPRRTGWGWARGHSSRQGHLKVSLIVCLSINMKCKSN